MNYSDLDDDGRGFSIFPPTANQIADEQEALDKILVPTGGYNPITINWLGIGISLLILMLCEYFNEELELLLYIVLQGHSIEMA